MIHDVDETLRALLRRSAVVTTDIEIAFEAPTKDWASRRNVPTLDVFLYDIRESLDRRRAVYDEVVDANGRITKRKPTTRWFNLSYLITAWTQRTEDEHRLLSSVLGLFLTVNQFPREILVGRLADMNQNCTLNIARPPSQERAISDMWSALGGELKPSLDLVLSVPFEPAFEFYMGPPVKEAPSVRMLGPDGGYELPPGRRTREVAAEMAAEAEDLLDRAPGTRRGAFAPLGLDSFDRDDDSAEARARRAFLARKAAEEAEAAEAARLAAEAEAAAEGKGKGKGRRKGGGSGDDAAGDERAAGGAASSDRSGADGEGGEGEGGEGAEGGDAERPPSREELIAGTPRLPGRRYGFSIIEPPRDKKKP